NSDSKLDIAVSNENSANVSVLLGNGNGGFGSPFNFNTGHLPTNLAVADFNEDNKPDITTPDGGDNTLTVLLNTCSSCPWITLNQTSIPAGTAGTAYSQTFTATGGTAPYSFALTGSLPTGLSFTSPTLSGTPTQSGSFPITVTATDASG